jgi:hypothetical protein
MISESELNFYRYKVIDSIKEFGYVKYSIIYDLSKIKLDQKILRKIFRYRLKKNSYFLYSFEAKCSICGKIHLEEELSNFSHLNNYILFLNNKIKKKNIEDDFLCTECLAKSKLITDKNINQFTNAEEFINIFVNNNFTLYRPLKKCTFKKFYLAYISLSREDRIVIYKTLRNLNYEVYLKTLWWKIIKSEVLRLYKYTCCNCNFKKSRDKLQKDGLEFDVHHKTYKYRGCEIINLDSLECLCKECHKLIHFK